MAMARCGRIPCRAEQVVSWLQTARRPWSRWRSAIGAITGLGAVGFRLLITSFTRMFTGYDDYSGLGRVPSAHWPSLGIWFLLLARGAGADLRPDRASVRTRGARARCARGDVRRQLTSGGRIAPQVSLVKALASALCIGGGGSVGREGPIVQIGSAAGSTVAQVLRLDTARVRLLVACGAAAGISATFNAPLAGTVLRDGADPA